LFHLLDTRGVEEFIGGAAQPQITLKSIGALEVLAPPSHLREEFGSVAGPLLGCGQSLRTKITSLSQIMDALLPKLVSGEIDVSDLDLDAVMEGVV
jgi:type I restriction enzyme S subunit